MAARAVQQVARRVAVHSHLLVQVALGVGVGKGRLRKGLGGEDGLLKQGLVLVEGRLFGRPGGGDDLQLVELALLVVAGHVLALPLVVAALLLVCVALCRSEEDSFAVGDEAAGLGRPVFAGVVVVGEEEQRLALVLPTHVVRLQVDEGHALEVGAVLDDGACLAPLLELLRQARVLAVGLIAVHARQVSVGRGAGARRDEAPSSKVERVVASGWLPDLLSVHKVVQGRQRRGLHIRHFGLLVVLPLRWETRRRFAPIFVNSIRHLK